MKYVSGITFYIKPPLQESKSLRMLSSKGFKINKKKSILRKTSKSNNNNLNKDST